MKHRKISLDMISEHLLINFIRMESFLSGGKLMLTDQKLWQIFQQLSYHGCYISNALKGEI